MFFVYYSDYDGRITRFADHQLFPTAVVERVFVCKGVPFTQDDFKEFDLVFKHGQHPVGFKRAGIYAPVTLIELE